MPNNFYPDLPLTVFPSGGIDSFTTWLDIIASDGTLVLQYQQAMQAGNTVLANQILAQIPSATQKIIKATDLNKMTQAILAVERFYKTDVEPYIQEQQTNWLEIIQRFSYKGEWASGTTYEVNNFVSYTVSGATLIYLATSNPPVGTPPTNTNYWRLLSIQGQQGPSGDGVSYREEWAPTTQYYKDDTVTYGGALWIATQNSQGQTPQSGSQYWKLVMSLGLTTYPIQDSEPIGQEVGGLWFNTQVNPTNYYQLAALENPATAAQISAGYEAYNDDGEVITGTQSMDDYLKTDGSNAMTGALNMNNQKIVNVSNGTNANDAVNYSQLSTKLNTSGGTMTGQLSMSSNKITNLADGTAATDAATVGQLNAAIASAGPQYAHPTGNTHIDFYGLSIWVKQNISPAGFIFDTNEQNCFTTLYKYLTGNDPTVSSEITYRAIVQSSLQNDNRNWTLSARFNENNQWYLYYDLSQNNPKFMYLYNAT